MSEGGYRCGLVALVGRPNVGKSTLLNRLLGQKVSIISRRPQTTRHRILGIHTRHHAQVVYVDTPGLHLRAGRAINRYMNRAADAAIHDVDVVVMLVEALRWTEEDRLVLSKCQGRTVMLAINKVDRVRDKRDLLPYIADRGGRGEFAEVIPISARTGAQLEALERAVTARLPRQGPLFSEDQVTDRGMRFLSAELIRERLMERLGEELPYRLSVEIERYVEEPALARIDAVIWVERPSQKGIVIGKGGHLLKVVGREARLEIEAMIERKVHLRLWVKVKENWSDDERLLRQLGYED